MPAARRPPSDGPVLERVVAVLHQVTRVPAASIHAGTGLYADLHLDSLQALELLFELEDAFGVDIDTDSSKALRTVGDVVALLERLVAPRR